MESQSSSCPYGLRSLLECFSRATLLSEPKDIPDFLNRYLSELVSFRDSNNETDPKVACFLYEEHLENKLLRNVEGITRIAESKGTTDTCKTQWPTDSTSEDISAQGPSIVSKLPAPTSPHAPVIAEKSLPLNKQSITPEVLEPQTIRTRPTPPKVPKPESARTRPTRSKVQGPETTRRSAPTSHHAPVMAQRSVLPPILQKERAVFPQPRSHQAPIIAKNFVLPPIMQKEKAALLKPRIHQAQVKAEKSPPLQKRSLRPTALEPQNTGTWTTPPREAIRSLVQGPESTRRPAPTSHGPLRSVEEYITSRVHMPERSTELRKPVPDKTRTQFITRPTPPKAPKPESARNRPTTAKVLEPESTSTWSIPPIDQTQRYTMRRPSTPEFPEMKCLPPTKFPKLEERRSLVSKVLQSENWKSPIILEVSNAPELAQRQFDRTPRSRFTHSRSAELEMPVVQRPYRHTCPHLAKKLGIINFAHLED